MAQFSYCRSSNIVSIDEVVSWTRRLLLHPPIYWYEWSGRGTRQDHFSPLVPTVSPRDRREVTGDDLVPPGTNVVPPSVGGASLQRSKESCLTILVLKLFWKKVMLVDTHWNFLCSCLDIGKLCST